MSEEEADKTIKESNENSPKSENEKNISNKTDEEISSNSDEVNSKDKSSGDKSETTKSQGKNRRNSRNNKRRERHELPPNVDNLPPLSLKDMQEKDINDIKLIKESLVAKDAVVWRPTKTEVSEYKPVFLIGFPRSGTTLLDNILSSHPLIQVVEERPLIENLKRMLFGPMTLKNLNSLTNNKINQLRDIYFSALRKNLIILPETKIIVDKFPLDIVHTPLILRVFPEAKFIFSLRHPCDCILSCFMQNFKINIAMSNFLSLKTSAILYDEVMTLWESCEQIFSPERIYIKYEDVVNDLKYGVQPALRFLDLDWDPNLLNYQQTALSKGFIKTPSYNQVIQKLTNQPIGRWKNYHSHFTPFLPKLKVWLKKFEYEFDQ